MRASIRSRWQSADVRCLLEQVLLSDDELHALCIDHFPVVHTQLGSGMTRTEKLNTLLRLYADDLDAVVAALARTYPERLARAARPPASSPWRLRERGEGPPPPDPIRFRQLRGIGNIALSCDRSEQWQAMLQIAGRSGAEVVLLPGPRGEGHDYFVHRIHEVLPQQLRTHRPIRVLQVGWPDGRCPTLLRDGVAALAQALRCPAGLGAVRRQLQALLADAILILTHPCVHPAFDDIGDVLAYYGQWLPEILRELDPDAGCKLVQPIEWAELGLLWRLFAALLPDENRWARDVRSRAAAKRLVAKLGDKQDGGLPVVALSPLRPIRGHHVREFLERVRFPPAQRQQMLDHLRQSCPRSDDVLRWLAHRVPDEAAAEPDHQSSGAEGSRDGCGEIDEHAGSGHADGEGAVPVLHGKGRAARRHLTLDARQRVRSLSG